MKLMKTQGASEAMQMAHYKLTIIIINNIASKKATLILNLKRIEKKINRTVISNEVNFVGGKQ